MTEERISRGSPLPLHTTPEAPPLTARAGVGDGDLRHTVLRDPDAPPHRVRQALACLTVDELHQHGLSLFDAAFLTLFGHVWSRARIREVAAEAVRTWLWNMWEWHAAIRRLRHEADAGGATGFDPMLVGWDAAELRRQLGRARGVILAGFHYGPFRMALVDLVALGFDVVAGVDAHYWRDASEEIAGIPALARLGLVNVESRSGYRELRAALDRGAIVCLCFDGNTGVGGRAAAGRADEVLDFLGCAIRAKTGAARLAAATGAPLIFAATRRDASGVGRIELGPTMRAPQGSSGEATRAFAREAIRTLWAESAVRIEAEPWLWEGARMLHRWRIVANTPRAAPIIHDPAARVCAVLDAGRSIRVNERWVAEGMVSENPVWIDVRSMISFVFPKWARGLEAALRSTGGVDRCWLAANIPGDHMPIALLADLLGRDLLDIDSGGTPIPDWDFASVAP